MFVYLIYSWKQSTRVLMIFLATRTHQVSRPIKNMTAWLKTTLPLFSFHLSHLQQWIFLQSHQLMNQCLAWITIILTLQLFPRVFQVQVSLLASPIIPDGHPGNLFPCLSRRCNSLAMSIRFPETYHLRHLKWLKNKKRKNKAITPTSSYGNVLHPLYTSIIKDSHIAGLRIFWQLGSHDCPL